MLKARKLTISQRQRCNNRRNSPRTDRSTESRHRSICYIYYELAKTVKESVSNDVVIVVLTFFDGEGNELYTQSFSSAEEAAAE